MTLTCEECHEPFDVPPSRSSAKWCSWACRTAQPRRLAAKPRTRPCANCGQTIQSKPSKHNQYCSLACYHSMDIPARRSRIQCECGFCGDTFEKRPSEIARGRGKFCSRRCAQLGRPINGRPSVIATAAIDEWASENSVMDVERELRVGRWSIDLAFPTPRVAIELDGEYWHSLPEMIEKDARKDAALADLGWTVQRILIRKNDTPSDIAAQITDVLVPLLEKTP